jgi:hypothetical protein
MSFLSRYDEFHDLAAQATGFDDFGPTHYAEPLRLLLSEYDARCHFGALGTQMVSAGIVGLLAGRLFAQHGFRLYPDVLTAKVEKPIIITGMMRTGSTALHRLLARDPANQWLPPWLASTPMPRPPRDCWESNPCYQKMAAALAQLYQLSPKIKQIHPMLPDQPDECWYAMNQTFWSPSLSVLGTVPDYAAWALNGDARYAYQYYRQLLGLIAGGSTARWLLKDPCHLWKLDTLLETFPDACVVYTHRDPAISITSLISLVYEVRRPREPDLTPEQHGRELLALWSAAQAKAEIVRNRNDQARFFDVHIDEIRHDPVGTAERIYRHFDLPFDDTARRSMRAHASAGQHAEHHPHRYRPEDFGFTARDVYASIGGYYGRYQQLYGKISPSATN